MSGYQLSASQKRTLEVRADAAPRPTAEQRARLRPLLAGRPGCPCGCNGEAATPDSAEAEAP